MAGPYTPALKSNRQYGDRTALDSLAITGSGLKQGNADYVPQTRRPVGRPQGATSTSAQPQQVAPAIPQEHIAMMEDFARSALVAQVAQAAAQDMMAGPWLRKYAEIAQREVQRKADALRQNTPFFEE